MTIPLPQRKFIYKLGPNATDVAAVLSRELRRRGFATAVLLASSDGHGEAGVRAMPRAFVSGGGTISHTLRLPVGRRLHRRGQADRHTLKPKAVVIWSLAPASAAAVAALRTAGYTGPVFLDSGAGADETLSGPNGSAMDGRDHRPLRGARRRAADGHHHLRAGRPRLHLPLHPAVRGLQRVRAVRRRRAEPAWPIAARRAISLDPQRLRGRLEGGAVEGITGAYAFQPISHGGLEPDALVLFTAHQGAWVRI